MRIGYFDCFSGVSGNMILGAMLDAGLQLTQLEADLVDLALPGWRLEVKQEQRHGLTGTYVAVVPTRHEHVHRHLSDIEGIITKSQLPVAVKEKALAVFTRLAQAEGLVHGVPAEKVHFHEVGAVDSIVDIVGAIAGFYRLQLEQIWVSPIHVGCGTVETQHGLLPVPAPATAELLKGVPVYTTGCQGELATPTGAAILRIVANGFGSWPAMVVQQTGYGLGTRELAHPNALRLVIGESTDSSINVHHQVPAGLEHDVVQVLEANVDDMNPQLYAHVLDSLLAAGALDVYYTPVIMKKGRMGCKLTALVTDDVQEACLATILQQTTTLGVRIYSANRAKLTRHWQTISLTDGTVRVKIGSWQNKIVNVAPEYEDCRKLAETSGKPLKEILNEALATAQPLIAKKIR